MKKPKKENLSPINENDAYHLGRVTGKNQMCDDWQKYHLWDTKTNYIHKDRLSVERIEKTIEIYAQRMKNLGLKNEGAFLSIHKDNIAIIVSNQLKRWKMKKAKESRKIIFIIIDILISITIFMLCCCFFIGLLRFSQVIFKI